MPKLFNLRFLEGWYFLNCHNTGLKISFKNKFCFRTASLGSRGFQLWPQPFRVPRTKYRSILLRSHLSNIENRFGGFRQLPPAPHCLASAATKASLKAEQACRVRGVGRELPSVTQQVSRLSAQLELWAAAAVAEHHTGPSRRTR